MKRYCLTQCFKRKMSERWDTTVQWVIVILLSIAFTVILAGIGWIAVFLGISLPDGSDYLELGFMLTISTVVTSGGLYVGYLWVKSLARSASKFVRERYEGEPYQCSIFEECR